MKNLKQSSRRDVMLIVLVWLAVATGLMILASASSVVSFQKFGWSYYYLQRQILAGVIPGLLLFIVCSLVDYKKILHCSKWAFFLNILALIGVLIPGLGVSAGGASRWLNLYFISFQPSELIKLTFLLYLACWLTSKTQEEIRSWSKGLLPFVIHITVVVGLLLLQPDMGTAMVVLVVAVALYFAAGAKWSSLAALVLAGTTALYFLIKIAPYRLNRLTAFLNPEFDPQGIGYHINQALLAVGSGGWLGLGLGHSRQKYQYLPEVTGDSIFAIAAEELGFIMISLVILLLVAIVWRCFKQVKVAADLSAGLVCYGVGVWIGIQIFVNIGAMLGLLPLTGVPLPFVSHGGTALTSLLASLGIVVNISSSSRQTENRR